MITIAPTSRRWLDLSLLFAIGTATGYLITQSNTAEQINDWLTRPVAHHSLYIALALATLSSTLLFATSIHLSLFRLSHFTNRAFSQLLYYPPTWLAAIAATALAITFGHHQNNHNTHSPYLLTETPFFAPLSFCHPLRTIAAFLLHPIFNLPILACASLLISKLLAPKPSKPNHQKPLFDTSNIHSPQAFLNHLTDNPKELDRWLDQNDKEAPIKSPKDDLFNHAPHAHNIAKQLRQPTLPTIGLIGELGSGKTSILNMVDHILATQNSKEKPYKPPSHQIWTCRAGLWGITKNQSPAYRILQEAVNEIANHLDPTAVSTLPSTYTKTIANSDVPFAKTFASLINHDSPLELLERFDPILEAANARLVIFIEDHDRNQTDVSIPLEVQSLIDHLHQRLKHVSFVVATSLDSTQDTLRFFDHTHHVPKLPTLLVAGLVRAFRHNQIINYNFIDPLPNQSPLDDDPLGALWITQHNHHQMVYHPLIAIAELLSNPRTLNSVLRATRHSWNILHGEIDFDDLLVAHTLRFTDPNLFDFLRDNHELITLDKPTKEDGENDETHPWYQLRNSINTDKPPARSLASFLYPYPTETGPFSNFTTPRKDPPPQGLGTKSTDRYWQRFLTTNFQTQQAKDQEVLDAICQCKNDDNPRAITEKLYNASSPDSLADTTTFAQIYLYFSTTKVHEAYKLTPDLHLATLTDYHDLIIKKKGMSAILDDQLISQYVSIQSVIIGKTTIQERIQMLLTELQRILPKSFTLFSDIRRSWGFSYHNDPSMNQEAIDQIFQESNQHAATYFKAQGPQTLLTILKTCDTYPLSTFLRKPAIGHRLADKMMTNDLEWFGTLILDTLKLEPETVLPHLTMLLAGDSTQSTRSGTYTIHTVGFKLRKDILNDVFPKERHEELITTICNTNMAVSHTKDEHTKFIFKQLQNHFQTYRQ